MEPASAAQVARLREALREKLRRQGFQHTMVSDRLSWRRDRVSRLLAGTSQLSVEGLYAILGAAGLEPGDFFAELHGFTVVLAGPEGRSIRLAVPRELLAQAVAGQLQALVNEGLWQAAAEAVGGVPGKDPNG